MGVIKLGVEHREAVRGLFDSSKYMGMNLADFGFGSAQEANQLLYTIFCNNYLSEIETNFVALGWQDGGGKITAAISFYQSTEEPAWYYTMHRSKNSRHLSAVLDAVIQLNEAAGLLKFYTLTSVRHSRLLRKFHWSKKAAERYEYVDEFTVPARARCYYALAWELLYKRTLLPVPTQVRCNFLKQEYRETLPQGGNI